MNEFDRAPVIALLVIFGAVLIILAVLVVRRSQRRESPDIAPSEAKYPEGYWLSVGISVGLLIGMAFAVAVGLAMGNIALGMAIGPGMGLAIGAAIGAALEQRHKNEIRPLTAEERRTRSRMTIAGLVALSLGVLTFLALFLSRSLG